MFSNWSINNFLYLHVQISAIRTSVDFVCTKWTLFAQSGHCLRKVNVARTN